MFLSTQLPITELYKQYNYEDKSRIFKHPKHMPQQSYQYQRGESSIYWDRIQLRCEAIFRLKKISAPSKPRVLDVHNNNARYG